LCSASHKKSEKVDRFILDTLKTKTQVAYKPPGFQFFGAGNGILKLPDKSDIFNKPQYYQLAIQAIPPVKVH
jgi:hypothetical protein